MNTLLKLSVIFIILLTEISCSKEKTKVIKHVDSITISKSVKINCRETPDVSYYIYLPAKYDINKNYPVILIFDPKARGKVSVNLFSEWADKYGYILVGSNNNKNGMDFSSHEYIFNSIYNDVINKVTIDSSRIYLAGFSGGARVAQNIANSNMNIAGIACCEAGCQEPLNRDNKFCYISFAGYWDFNYSEVKQTENIFQKAVLPNHFIYFDGKHDWPPKNILENIFIYFETQNLRKNPDIKNQTKLIITVKNELKTKMNESEILSVTDKFQLQTNYNNFFGGLRNLNWEPINIISDSEYNNVINFQNNSISETKKQLEKFLGALNIPGSEFTNPDNSDKVKKWWNTELNKIKKVINFDKRDIDWYVSKRIYGALSLYSYMLAIKAMDAGETQKAELLISIYEKVDPENPDLEYLQARNYAANGDKDKAMTTLTESFEKGLDDYDRLQNDKFLSKLPGVWDIVDKIKEKYY